MAHALTGSETERTILRFLTGRRLCLQCTRVVLQHLQACHPVALVLQNGMPSSKSANVSAGEAGAGVTVAGGRAGVC